MRLISRSDIMRRLLIAPLIVPQFVAPPPAAALIGEVTGKGFTQADDKSWDFSLPSDSWKVETTDPRAEAPKRVFRVQGRYGAGAEAASFELNVEPSGAKSFDDLGSVKVLGQKLAPTIGTLEVAEVVPGVVKGSKYYEMRYSTAAGGQTMLRISAKQGRTYTFAVSLPASPSASLRSEADALLQSFKCFPVNIICLTQSSGGSSPVPGSCY